MQTNLHAKYAQQRRTFKRVYEHITNLTIFKTISLLLVENIRSRRIILSL